MLNRVGLPRAQALGFDQAARAAFHNAPLGRDIGCIDYPGDHVDWAWVCSDCERELESWIALIPRWEPPAPRCPVHESDMVRGELLLRFQTPTRTRNVEGSPPEVGIPCAREVYVASASQERNPVMIPVNYCPRCREESAAARPRYTLRGKRP